MDPKKSEQQRRRRERTLYIVLIVLLTLYGLVHTEEAATLIRAISEAFSVLLSNP